MTDNRNLILAVALSIAVVFGWQYFIAGPRMEQAQKEQAAVTAANSPAPAAGGTTPATGAGATTTAGAPTQALGAGNLTREAALAATPRVAVDTPSVSGSINLKGGRLDDLRLKGYRETVDPTSPTIILLSPSGAPDGYFAEFGWVGAEGGTAGAGTRHAVDGGRGRHAHPRDAGHAHL